MDCRSSLAQRVTQVEIPHHGPDGRQKRPELALSDAKTTATAVALHTSLRPPSRAGGFRTYILCFTANFIQARLTEKTRFWDTHLAEPLIYKKVFKKTPRLHESGQHAEQADATGAKD